MLEASGGGGGSAQGGLFTPPPGDPGAIRSAANQLKSHGTSIGDLAASARRTSVGLISSGDWEGQASDKYSSFSGNLIGLASDAEAPVGTMAGGANQYADALDTIKRKLADASSRHQSASARAESIKTTTNNNPNRTPAQVQAAQAEFDKANAEAKAAEDDARRAWAEYDHESNAAAKTILGAGKALDSGTRGSSVLTAVAGAGGGGESAVSSEKLLKAFGVMPEDPNSPVDVSHWLGESALKGADSTKEWALKVKYGRFAPRGANGRFVSPKSLSMWERMKAGPNERNWIAKAGASDTRGMWKATGDVLDKVGKGSVVASFGVSAWDQWQKDSHNPNLDTTNRVTRAVTAGTTTAAATWAGAEAGAGFGATVGSIFPGPGTVVGGFVGGVIGGAAGALGSGWANDHIVGPIGDGVDKLVHDPGGALSSVAHSSVVHNLEPWNW